MVLSRSLDVKWKQKVQIEMNWQSKLSSPHMCVCVCAYKHQVVGHSFTDCLLSSAVNMTSVTISGSRTRNLASGLVRRAAGTVSPYHLGITLKLDLDNMF